jgi:hypothetical protein
MQWQRMESLGTGELANATDGMGGDFVVYRGSAGPVLPPRVNEPTIVEEFPEIPTNPQSPYGQGIVPRPILPRSGNTYSGEFDIRDMPNPPVDQSPLVDTTFARFDNAVAKARLAAWNEAGGAYLQKTPSLRMVNVPLNEFHTLAPCMQGGCGLGAKSTVAALEAQGFSPANIFLNQNEEVVGGAVGRHVYSVLDAPHGPYIFDTTVAQFPEIPGNALWNATRADLIRNGYTPLTDEVATAYTHGVSLQQWNGPMTTSSFMQPQFRRELWPDLGFRWP